MYGVQTVPIPRCRVLGMEIDHKIDMEDVLEVGTVVLSFGN